MADMTGLNDLMRQIREASANLEKADARSDERFTQLERSVNELFKKTQRPSYGADRGDDDFERKCAIGMCEVRHRDRRPKDDGIQAEYVPSPSEIDEALSARRALKALFRHGDVAKLDNLERKSLSSFSFGTTSGFLLSPEMSDITLSCLSDPTDVTGWVNTVNISAPSVKFLVDNARTLEAGWSCDASCFANNPQPDLAEGLGELEIKAETLRYVVCCTSDLVQDASFDVQNWVLRKVEKGFRAALNTAILAGDGVGRPLGILAQTSGVPICQTSESTPPGQISWADLLMLKYEIPLQWHAGAAFYCNQRTFAMLMASSDAVGKPIYSALPENAPGYQIAGSPVRILSQLPDIGPGSTPVLFGNLKEGYLLAIRSGTSLVVDPYSANFCQLYKFSMRAGGAPACPNAMRLLRVR